MANGVSNILPGNPVGTAGSSTDLSQDLSSLLGNILGTQGMGIQPQPTVGS